MKKLLLIFSLLLACSVLATDDSLHTGDLEDTWLSNGGAANLNFGITPSQNFQGISGQPFLLKVLAGALPEGPVTVSSCTIGLRLGAATGITVNIRRVTSRWDEGEEDGSSIGPGDARGATFNKRSDCAPICGDGSDTTWVSGAWSSSDYDGISYQNTDVDGATYVEFTSDSLASDMQGFINGTYSVRSWVITSNSATTVVSSTEDSPRDPYVLFTYTAVVADTPVRRRKALSQ